MPPRQPFSIVYDDQVKQHLRVIDTKLHSLIRAAIVGQLTHEPDVETRNRKTLERPILADATWELRCGPDNRYRVFYKLETNTHSVVIVAVGVKIGNRLFIGGIEVKS